MEVVLEQNEHEKESRPTYITENVNDMKNKQQLRQQNHNNSKKPGRFHLATPLPKCRNYSRFFFLLFLMIIIIVFL